MNKYIIALAIILAVASAKHLRGQSQHSEKKSHPAAAINLAAKEHMTTQFTAVLKDCHDGEHLDDDHHDQVIDGDWMDLEDGEVEKKVIGAVIDAIFTDLDLQEGDDIRNLSFEPTNDGEDDNNSVEAQMRWWIHNDGENKRDEICDMHLKAQTEEPFTAEVLHKHCEAPKQHDEDRREEVWTQSNGPDGDENSTQGLHNFTEQADSGSGSGSGQGSNPDSGSQPDSPDNEDGGEHVNADDGEIDPDWADLSEEDGEILEGKLMALYDGEFAITEGDEAKIVRVKTHNDGEDNDMISAEIRIWITRAQVDGEAPHHEICNTHVTAQTIAPHDVTMEVIDCKEVDMSAHGSSGSDTAGSDGQ